MQSVHTYRVVYKMDQIIGDGSINNTKLHRRNVQVPHKTLNGQCRRAIKACLVGAHANNQNDNHETVVLVTINSTTAVRVTQDANPQHWAAPVEVKPSEEKTDEEKTDEEKTDEEKTDEEVSTESPASRPRPRLKLK